MLMASENSYDDGDYDFDFPVSPGGPYWKIPNPELVMQYFTVLKISGSPYVLLVDTGSSLTWIQCLPCDPCFNQVAAPIFDPRRSLTYKVRYCGDHTSYKSPCRGCNERGECTYSIVYGDKSYSRGVMGEEVCRFGLKNDIEMTFPMGCAHNSSRDGSFNGSDGVLGLGRGELSFASQIDRKYGFKKFSYCLLDKSMTAEPSVLSSLTFGPHVLDQENDVVYTPMIQNPNSPRHYFINLTSISVAGKLIPIQTTSLPHGILVDSGTVLTWLPRLTYEAVRDSYRDAALQLNWERVDDQYLETCYDLGAYIGERGIDWVTAPEVILYFAGYDDKAVEIKLRTQNVLFTYPWIRNDIYCLALLPSESEGTAILGNVQQQGIRVVYDNVQSAIGFDVLSC
ncbi:hypothetical protein MKW94_029308 [Papaver nudicaule]|uniref:Peptidase A1 domain-containing protein n=1 Tax=Papaver nudicaule TaxID=74823 RepID=A0AA41V1Z5_PAPNU|nr:hypothetical protein [Papaver nudicaule]